MYVKGIGTPRDKVDREDILVIGDLDVAGRRAPRGQAAKRFVRVGIRVAVVVDEAIVRAEPIGSGPAAAKGVYIICSRGIDGEGQPIIRAGARNVGGKADC